MENNKYKILVLSNLRDSTRSLLKSTDNLAKMIGAEVDFFSVIKPTDVIKKDNQLSAMRTFNQEYIGIKNKIEKEIKSVSTDHNITYSFAVGNVKNEINSYIETSKPDIIVLGKRKSNSLNFIGDNIIDFILKKHKGVVMLVNKKNALGQHEKLSMGLLNNTGELSSVPVAEDIIKQIQEPFVSFRVVNSNVSSGAIESNNLANNKTVEYVFEHNDNTVENLANYLSKNNINLLCIDRGEKGDNTLDKGDIKNIINKIDMPILLTN